MPGPKIMHEDQERVALAFAYVLTTIREERHLSEEDFARSAGLGLAHYWNLESGSEEPSLYCLLRIAAAIDGKPEELVKATCERLIDLGPEAKAAQARATGRSA